MNEKAERINGWAAILDRDWETLKSEFQGAIINTKHNEDEARKALWQAYHITDRVENHLRQDRDWETISPIVTGKL